MNDLISRQAAIEAIGNYLKKDGDKLVIADVVDAAVAIGRLPSAQPEQRWIPVSERLPDQNGKYLVVGRQKAINILKFDDGRWYGKWGVVAWMPLPDCYQGDGNNEM